MSTWREDRERRRAADHDRRAAERKQRLNQRDHSPAPWKEDPYLSSAGDGPGYYDGEDCDRDD